jgi:hypothetical protein
MKPHRKHNRTAEPTPGAEMGGAPGPRHFDLELKSNEQEEEGGGYARARKPEEHPRVPLADLPNRGG